MTRESNHIPSLDGLRCTAVSMVLFGHLLGTRGFLRPSTGIFFYEFGNLGVKVFFVISGCLITNLLLHELEKQTEYTSESFTLAGPSEYFRRVTAWCATASYYLIEQPCLGVRQYLEKIAFANGPKPATVPANPEVSLDASGVA